jgi:hypothetical protein
LFGVLYVFSCATYITGKSKRKMPQVTNNGIVLLNEYPCFVLE